MWDQIAFGAARALASKGVKLRSGVRSKSSLYRCKSAGAAKTSEDRHAEQPTVGIEYGTSTHSKKRIEETPGF
jgi:hypothetical protein